MRVPERTEAYTERGLSAAFVLSGAVTLAVVLASFIIPTEDDVAGGGAAARPSARPSIETHRALLERCNDRETWVPGHPPANATLWDSFVRTQAARAEARYCEQWLGGRLLVDLLGLGHPKPSF